MKGTESGEKLDVPAEALNSAPYPSRHVPYLLASALSNVRLSVRLLPPFADGTSPQFGQRNPQEPPGTSSSKTHGHPHELNTCSEITIHVTASHPHPHLHPPTKISVDSVHIVVFLFISSFSSPFPHLLLFFMLRICRDGDVVLGKIWREIIDAHWRLAPVDGDDRAARSEVIAARG